MALDANILGDKIDAVVQQWIDKDIADNNLARQRKAYWNAVAAEIISYIKSNAEVVIANVPVSTTGTAAAQSGFANGKATIV